MRIDSAGEATSFTARVAVVDTVCEDEKGLTDGGTTGQVEDLRQGLERPGRGPTAGGPGGTHTEVERLVERSWTP